MSDVAIRIENLGKRFQLRHAAPGTYRTLREDLLHLPKRVWHALHRASSNAEEFWALRDVSLELKQGEILGLIGRNGAGKSTLLKILSRIISPTTGSADLFGRVGSLLEVGTGFHPELTGRENIFLSGAILGMRRQEVRARFDEIVAFAGVEKFIDTACKHYSSGMYARLGFAVAAHLDTEILLVDEVLAVGDAEFQRRCLGKMGNVARSGRTVVFVSHNLAAVTALCGRAVWLEAGQQQSDGDSPTVVARYIRTAGENRTMNLADRTDRRGDGRLRFSRVSFRGDGEGAVPVCGGELRVEVDFYCRAEITSGAVRFAFLVQSFVGDPLFTLDSIYTHDLFACLPTAGQVTCSSPHLPLAPGRYRINLWCTIGDDVADFIQDAADLEVHEGDFYGTGRSSVPAKNGPFLVSQEWSVNEASIE